MSNTLNKILKNSKPKRPKRNNSCSLRSFLTEKNIEHNILEDDEILNKIKNYHTKVKYEKEIKELYDKKVELKAIESEPVYPDYIGHTFRKCYQNVLAKNQSEINCSTSSEEKACHQAAETVDNGVEGCNMQQSAMSATKEKEEEEPLAKLPLLPNLSAEWEDIHHKHLIESLQSYQYLNDLTMPEKPPLLADDDKFEKEEGKKLLVLDMDETLIHCLSGITDDTKYDVKIPYKFFNKIAYKYVNIRPYVIE